MKRKNIHKHQKPLGHILCLGITFNPLSKSLSLLLDIYFLFETIKKSRENNPLAKARLLNSSFDDDGSVVIQLVKKSKNLKTGAI